MKIIKESNVPSAKSLLGEFYDGLTYIKQISELVEKYASRVTFVDIGDAYKHLSFDNVEVTFQLSKPIGFKLSTIKKQLSSVKKLTVDEDSLEMSFKF